MIQETIDGSRFFLEIKTDEDEDREENLTRTHHPKRIENQMFPLFPHIINHRNKINQSQNRTLTKNVNVDVCRVRNKKKLNKMTFITLQKKTAAKEEWKTKLCEIVSKQNHNTHNKSFYI